MSDNIFSEKVNSKIFQNSMNNFIHLLNKNEMNQMMGNKNQSVIFHGRSINSLNNETDLKQLSVKLEYKYDDVKDYNIKSFNEFINIFASEMTSQMKKTIYEVISKTCEETGNIIDGNETELSNPQMFLEMLKKIELSVNEDGKVELPAIHMHPDMAQKFIEDLESQGEQFNQQVEQIKEEKIKQAFEKEKVRLLKFKGYIDA